MKTRRIAVYGGSFNPFGKHHQDIVRWLIEEGGFNTVLVVPSAAHALKGDQETISILQQAQEIAISSISIGELLSGFKAGRKERKSSRR